MLAIYRTKRKRQPKKQIGVREVCELKTADGQRCYRGRAYDMEVRQGFKCAICTRISGSMMEFDHQDGRGMGGSNRDDRIVDADGNWINAALCHECNRLKGSKRYHWVDGKYVQRSAA